jgi:hypothetical protein
MRWDARGTIALLVSALVGVTAGVIVGISSGSPGASSADPGGPTQSSSQPASPTSTDPLGIGAPLVNLDCTGQKILVVGSGETTGALTNAVSANPGADVKYLETAKSCNTLYGAEKQDPPAYVVYLGPFDTTSEPCSLRMSIDHKNDVVTNLKPNVKIHVQCLCVLDPATFPELAVGMRPTTQDGIYIRALQRLLVDIGQNPHAHITGVYDAQTAKMVRPLQQLNAIQVSPPGLVETSTWQMLRDRGCVNYDF